MHVTILQDFDLIHDAAQLLMFKAGNDAKRFSATFFDEAGSVAPTRELIEAARTLDALVTTLFERLALSPEDIALFTPDLSAEQQTEEENSLMCPFKCGSMLGFDEIVRRIRRMDEGDIRAFLMDESLLADETPSTDTLWENRDERTFTRNVLTHPDWSSEQKCHLLTICTDYHAYFDRAASILDRCVNALIPLLPQLVPLLKTYTAALSQSEPGACPELLSSIREMTHDEEKVLVYPQLSWPRAVVLRLRRPDPVHPTPVDAFLHDVNGMFVYFGLYAAYVPELLRDQPDISSDDLLCLLKALSDKSKLDILSILAAEPCYGAQLAQRLSLSPATISHHMNVLLSNALVRMSEQENRIYYRTNPERIRAVLRALENALLPH